VTTTSPPTPPKAVVLTDTERVNVLLAIASRISEQTEARALLDGDDPKRHRLTWEITHLETALAKIDSIPAS
jgi:hypothetical protein